MSSWSAVSGNVPRVADCSDPWMRLQVRRRWEDGEKKKKEEKENADSGKTFFKILRWNEMCKDSYLKRSSVGKATRLRQKSSSQLFEFLLKNTNIKNDFKKNHSFENLLFFENE